MIPTGVRAGLWQIGWALVLASLTGAHAHAESDSMPRPPQLERDVQFWIRVYTQLDTNAGFLHDQYDLSVVYDTLHFGPGATPADPDRQVDAARDRCAAPLRRIAAAAGSPQPPA